jgi:hypothetical protein
MGDRVDAYRTIGIWPLQYIRFDMLRPSDVMSV